MNKKNEMGFTLVELLVVIGVIGLIFLIVMFNVNGIFDNTDKKIDKTTKDMIIQATNNYVLEFRGSEGWKENAEDSSFCVSLNSLLRNGYYDYKNEYINENKDDLFVYVTINSERVFEYEIIDVNEKEDKCKDNIN